MPEASARSTHSRSARRAIAFDAIFPNPSECGSLGSVYVKSRSSDSFQSEIKDFIAPESVSLSNCTSMTTTARAR